METESRMRISEQVERVLIAMGISTRELQRMVSQAAITRFRSYNKRYFQWVFKVNDSGEVELMAIDRTEIIGQGEALVYEDHEDCSGAGCLECGFSGEIGRRVTDRVARLIEDNEPVIMSHKR